MNQRPSRIATLMRLFSYQPPAGIGDNQEVGQALAGLADKVRPQGANNMLEEFANLPGYALANTIDAAGVAVQPEMVVSALKQLASDPTPAIEGAKDFAKEVAQRPVAIAEQMSIGDLLAPGAASILTPSLKKGILKTLSDPKILRAIEGLPDNADVTPPARFLKGAAELAEPYTPQKTEKAYKLFRTQPENPEELYPLFVNADKPVKRGEWVSAEEGPRKKSGKVKSDIGALAFRPGWHAGSTPSAAHIGGKSTPDQPKADYRRASEVWAEVEMGNDVNWQAEALARAATTKAGGIDSKTAHITDQIPYGGFYRYKTNPNMEGNWLIGGEMRVGRSISPEEVARLNKELGGGDLPTLPEVIKQKNLSLSDLTDTAVDELKVYYPDFYEDLLTK